MSKVGCLRSTSAATALIMTSNELRYSVVLVPFTNDRIDLTFEWIKDRDFQHLFLMRGEPTLEGHYGYFERVLKDSTQRIYAILAENRHVGNCGLKNLLPSGNGGELWIYIGGSSMRGKGIGKYATELLLHEGFEVLGLEMIYVHVADFNTAALRLYEKLGFKEVPMIDDSNEWSDRGFKIIRMELMKQI